MVWTCTSCGGENPEGTRFCGHCGSGRDQAAAEVVADDRDSQVTEALRSFVSGQVADRLVEGDLAEERRLVTCLFADLSGFTPLADTLDPEQLLEVIDPVINTLTNVVGRYEGYVDKFAGDALLAFFGAPISHEDDAARALMVADEMHAELARMLPSLPESARHLTLHTGVNSGHVISRVLGTEVRMDYSVLGDAVILAQRLESAAPAGETYVGETTFRLTRDRFEFESIGELTLKGKKEPVPAWRLIGKKKRSRTTARFVGRKLELELLDGAINAIVAGSGRVISVSGEPGVGKSRITEEAQSKAEAQGALWLTARCLSYGSGIAYYPYIDLLRRLSGIHPHDPPETATTALTRLLEGTGLQSAFPYLARLLGMKIEDPVPLEPEAFRRELHSAITTALARLAANQPLIVALEDLHWADASSIALTAELAKVCVEQPFGLYATARREAVPVLVDIAAGVPEGIRSLIQLEPFEPAIIEELLNDLLEGLVPGPLVELVADRAAGNPFFVEEIVRSLQDTGALVRKETGWELPKEVDAAQIPPTLEGVLSARIDALPRRAAAVLQVSSVIGRRVRLPLLKGVEKRARDLDSTLQVLIEGGFLDPDEDEPDDLLFHHALVQDVAYSRLLRRRRKELHRKVANVAEEIYGAQDDYIDLLARHLYLGDAGPKAIEYLVRAGDRARSLFANDEAIVHLSRAAEVARSTTDTVDQIPDILVKLADLHELRGHYEDSLQLYSDVRDQDPQDVRAWRGIAASLRNRGHYVEALSLLEEAFVAVKPDADRSSLWLERGWTLNIMGRAEEAIDALEAGVSETADHLVRARLLLQMTRARVFVQDFDDALQHALGAVTLFEQRDDAHGLATALRIVGGTYWEMGRLDDAATALKRGLAAADRVGSAEEIGGCLINLGLVQMERGELEEAIACDRRAIDEFERIGHGSGRAEGYGNLAEKLMIKGEDEAALLYSDRALEIAESIGNTPVIADVYKTMAKVKLRRQELEEAERMALLSADMFEEMGSASTAVSSLEVAIEACTAARRDERARELEARARSLTSAVS